MTLTSMLAFFVQTGLSNVLDTVYDIVPYPCTCRIFSVTQQMDRPQIRCCHTHFFATQVEPLYSVSSSGHSLVLFLVVEKVTASAFLCRFFVKGWVYGNPDELQQAIDSHTIHRPVTPY